MRKHLLAWLLALGACERAVSQDSEITPLEAAEQPGSVVRQSDASDQRTPVPPAAATKHALAQIKDIFRDEYAKSTTMQGRAAFARQLLAEGEKTTSPAERWALVSEAMRLAADAGDTDLTYSAIAQAAEFFKIDAVELKHEAISKLALKAPPSTLDDLARDALAIGMRAGNSDKPKIAHKSISLAAALARKTKNRSLLAEVTKTQQSLRDMEKESRELAAVVAKLDATPDDPDACLEAGKYFCFKGNDWPRGLSLLAKSSDTNLSRLAVAELNVSKDTAAVASLADAWWDWAEDESGMHRTAAMLHAADLYGSVLKTAAGLERARMEKRMKEASSQRAGRQEKRQSLTEIPEMKAVNLNGGLAKDGTFNGKPFTCGGETWPKSLTACPNSAGGSIVYALPPGARRLTGTAGVFAPHGLTGPRTGGPPLHFEILVDGHSVWKSPPLIDRDSTASFAVDLYGASQLELRTTTERDYSPWAAWLNPEITF